MKTLEQFRFEINNAKGYFGRRNIINEELKSIQEEKDLMESSLPFIEHEFTFDDWSYPNDCDLSNIGITDYHSANNHKNIELYKLIGNNGLYCGYSIGEGLLNNSTPVIFGFSGIDAMSITVKVITINDLLLFDIERYKELNERYSYIKDDVENAIICSFEQRKSEMFYPSAPTSTKKEMTTLRTNLAYYIKKGNKIDNLDYLLKEVGMDIRALSPLADKISSPTLKFSEINNLGKNLRTISVFNNETKLNLL